MATIFNKRLFGTDLDPEIKNKLKARQLLAENPILPTDSKEFVDIDGKEHNIKEKDIDTYKENGNIRIIFIICKRI